MKHWANFASTGIPHREYLGACFTPKILHSCTRVISRAACIRLEMKSHLFILSGKGYVRQALFTQSCCDSPDRDRVFPPPGTRFEARCAVSLNLNECTVSVRTGSTNPMST